MKIVSIKSIGKKPVYDISVKDAEHYVLDNGVITHNTGGYYSSDAIWIIGRQQDKDGKDLNGFNFVINIEKSRHVKEKSKIFVNVTFESGIMKWSGMLEEALDLKYVAKPKNGWYQRIDKNTGEFIGDKMFREKDIINNTDFWNEIIATTTFSKDIEDKYKVSNGKLLDKSSLEIEEDDE